MAGPRYRTDPPELFRVVELDGLTALFHRRSGLTHLLAAPAPQILEALAASPADIGEILARIGERFELGEEENDALEAMAARLAELETAGLVWRA